MLVAMLPTSTSSKHSYNRSRRTTMSSIDIYTILLSKPHNPHYLNRYWKFIQSRISTSEYSELHHICPKAKDLFPEYSSLSKNPWNKIRLSSREHFIAHWMLYKAYSGSQIYAFHCMCSGQKSKYQQYRYTKVNSKVYEQLKILHKTVMSESRKGIATYKDSDGNVGRYLTSDPRVLSGELISTTKGRSIKWSRQESRDNMSRIQNDAAWLKYPVRKINLYFLDIKYVLEYTRDTQHLISEYIEQGWQTKQTKEHKSKVSIQTNKNMSKEARKKAGRAISKACKNQVRSKLSTEARKKQRKKINHDYTEYFFNTKTLSFEYIDPLDITSYHLKVFTKTNSRVVFDINNKKRFVSNLVPTPSWLYDDKPHSLIKVYDTLSGKIISKYYKDLLNTDIKVFATNDNRKKVFFLDTNSYGYIQKELLHYNIVNIKY